jgi:Protein of unknown function (DUF2550)
MGIVEAVAVALLVALLALVLLAVRRRVLLRGNGAIDMSLRQSPGRTSRGWALGVGRYTADDLLWYRVFALTWRPSRTMSRRDLEVIGQRMPLGAESWAVQAGAVVVECRDRRGPLQLAMSEEALTGFLSWLEASPPGYTVPGYAAS